jgi:F-type H+-transporting ATPase subunit delta
MGERTLAKRYARALLSVAREKKVVDKVEDELHGVAQAWAGSPELRSALGDPSRSREAKRKLLEKLFGGRVSDVTLRFMGLLLEKKRFGLMADIAASYEELSDAAQGIARAKVTAFMPLDDAQRKALVQKLGKLIERQKIEVVETVDPSILGGVIVRVGDQVVDGSVRGRLRALRELLLVREDQIAAAAAGMVAAATKRS